MPSIPPRLLQLLQTLKPTRAGVNKWVNPWRSSGNEYLDFGKSALPASIAAVPATELINKYIYGGMMGRHYTGQDGKEIAGLDPQSKVMELLSNMALIMPAFHRPSMRLLNKHPTPVLLGKGITTMVIPSVADIFKSTQNTDKATGAMAGAADSLQKVLAPVADFAPQLGKALREIGPSIGPAAADVKRTMTENRNWATPFITGGIGAGVGSMLGNYLESDSNRLSAAEAGRQKRNRILLTLLGGGVGAAAGIRNSQGLPAFMPSAQEWNTGTAKAKELVAGLLGKQANTLADAVPAVAALAPTRTTGTLERLFNAPWMQNVLHPWQALQHEMRVPGVKSPAIKYPEPVRPWEPGDTTWQRPIWPAPEDYRRGKTAATIDPNFGAHISDTAKARVRAAMSVNAAP